MFHTPNIFIAISLERAHTVPIQYITSKVFLKTILVHKYKQINILHVFELPRRPDSGLYETKIEKINKMFTVASMHGCR